MISSAPSIIIRASNDSDPTAPGYEEVEIAIKSPAPDDVRVGDGVEDITYAAQASKLERRRFEFACMPMYVHSGQGSTFQTVAVLSKLRRLWRQYKYVWLWQVRERFGQATPFPWADEDGDDALFFASTHPTTPGILPIRISLAQVSQSPPSGGFVDADITVEEEGVI